MAYKAFRRVTTFPVIFSSPAPKTHIKCTKKHTIWHTSFPEYHHALGIRVFAHVISFHPSDPCLLLTILLPPLRCLTPFAPCWSFNLMPQFSPWCYCLYLLLSPAFSIRLQHRNWILFIFKAPALRTHNILNKSTMDRTVENIKSRDTYSSIMSYLLCRISFSLNFFGQSLHLCRDSHHLKLIQIKPLIRIQ